MTYETRCDACHRWLPVEHCGRGHHTLAQDMTCDCWLCAACTRVHLRYQHGEETT